MIREIVQSFFRFSSILLQDSTNHSGAFEDKNRSNPWKRPQIPLITFLALGMWLSCVIIFPSTHDVSRTSKNLVLLGAVILLILTLIFFVVVTLKFDSKQCADQVLSVFALGFCLGALVSLASSEQYLQKTQSVPKNSTQDCLMILQEDSFEGIWGTSVIAQIVLENNDSFIAQISLDAETSEMHFGEVYEGRAVLSQIEINEFNFNKGLEVRLKVLSSEKAEPLLLFPFHIYEGLQGYLSNFRNSSIELFQALPKEACSLLQALVCGYTTNLDASGLYSDYQNTGLAHLVAVSGSHLALINTLIASVLQRFNTPKKLLITIQLLFINLYLIFTALPVSGIRSGIMASLGLLSYISKRRSSSLNVLSVCMLLMISQNPRCASDVSFVLSAGSTLGIILLTPFFSHCFGGKIPRSVNESLSLTCAASVTTLPFSAALFAQLPIISLLANVLAAPFFALICTSGILCATVHQIFPAFAVPLLTVSGIEAAFLNELVKFLAKVPYACIPVSLDPSLMICVSILMVIAILRWGRGIARILKPLVVLVISAIALTVYIFPLQPTHEIIMLDVGQGDSFLFRSSGKTVLIDTGKDDSKLLRGLARHNIQKLDAVCITHGDSNHCGALLALKGKVRVGSVLLAADTFTCGCDSCSGLLKDAQKIVSAENIQGLQVGSNISFGVFRFTLLSPQTFVEEGGNADSLCFEVTIDGNYDGKSEWNGLFCGDAEADQLEELKDKNLLTQVTIYKVGHHGSKAALDEEIVEALSPDISLVSVGADNTYGHPAEETINLLENVGSEVLRSDQLGDVSCIIEPDKLIIKTQRKK